MILRRISSDSKKYLKKFGTISGVFVPSVLTILGAVMYLIAPKVLGGVGLIKMIAIIMIAHSITFATAFSISAIATNIQVKGGGLYYILSRSLGKAFGGSMGIQLYLAQSVGAAFYAIAFAKALHAILLGFGVIANEVFLAAGSFLIFFIIAYRGAGFVIKIQYLILFTIALSLVSVFMAPNGANVQAHLLGTHGVAIPFWVAFALFFPAVTGIDAGVGMSGELKDPKKSLVTGTFFAIFATLIIYLFLSLKMSLTATPMELSTDAMIVKNVAYIPSLVFIGILVATASSALSYLMTGPRSLRAMVNDGIIPKRLAFLGKSFGSKSQEPHVALILTFLIGECVLFMGGLDLVSQVVAMFFLNVYGWVNGAAFLEKISNSPSFRPTFSSPWIVSLYGMIACYFVMYLFNPIIMVVSIFFQVLIFYLLTKNNFTRGLESVWDGVLFQFLRVGLNWIEKSEKSKKNWRPTIVSFCINPKNQKVMIVLLNFISFNRSIMKLYTLIKGKFGKMSEIREQTESDVKEHIKEHDFELFPRAVVTPDFEVTFESIIQSEALGNLPLNTGLVDYDDKLDLAKFANISLGLNKNFMIMRNRSGFSQFKKVDVWWSERKDGNLAIMLAYLITHSKTWKENDGVIRLYNIVQSKKDMSNAKERINRVIKDSRIENIEINVMHEDEHNLPDVIQKFSGFSDLVILGMKRNKQGQITSESIRKAAECTKRLNLSLLVAAHDEISLD